MLPKSIVISSLLLGGVAIAGLGTARWLNPSQAQEPGPVAAARGEAAVPDQAEVAQRINNMKQILLAFHNYHDANGHFPPLANFGADGLPKLSWRVALLPYLAEDELYNEFHQDEPWDSPHNKALLGRMPAVFQTPGSPALFAGYTRIRGFGGKGAMFEGTQGIKIQEVTDGTSNTVLIAVAADAVPWTKPGELTFVEGEPLPALDASDSHGYTLGMCDGSVRMLHKSGERMLRSIITRAGGEVITWPQSEGPRPVRRAVTGTTLTPTPPRYLPTAPQPTPAPAPAGAATPSSYGPTQPLSLEQRMQRVEEKLDRILQKLDGLFPSAEGNRSRR